MKIGVIGASGKAGKIIVEEALSRNHEVIAIVRNALNINKDIRIIEKDIFQITRNDIYELDVVINAFGSKGNDPVLYQTTTSHLINIFTDCSTRLVVVGGAGSLYTDETLSTQVFETPEFPAVIYPTSSNMAKSLALLKDSQINWTFFTPAINFDSNGLKTGKYQIGFDSVILNSKGKSYISYQDYAIALLDEVENPRFIKKRFTAVSEN